jgi:peroxiredoxin
MAVWNKNAIYWVTALVLAFLVGLAVLNGCKKQPAEQAASGSSGAGTPSQPAANDPIEAAKNPFTEPKTSLQKAIEGAQTWEPVFTQWQGKIAPDFTLTDIEGDVHTLSSYRGKNVLVVCWATWCGPCRLEAPELIELRKAIGADKLAILAISREDSALLRNFAAQNQLNYTVLSSAGSTMPSPYADVEAIPSAFFIDPEGKIRLATMGMLSRSDATAILNAG